MNELRFDPRQVPIVIRYSKNAKETIENVKNIINGIDDQYVSKGIIINKLNRSKERITGIPNFLSNAIDRILSADGEAKLGKKLSLKALGICISEGFGKLAEQDFSKKAIGALVTKISKYGAAFAGIVALDIENAVKGFANGALERGFQKASSTMSEYVGTIKGLESKLPKINVGSAISTGAKFVSKFNVVGGVVSAAFDYVPKVVKYNEEGTLNDHAGELIGGSVGVVAGTAAGAVAGTAAGAAVGAAIGSVIPVAGTVVGLLVGGAVGAALGYFGGMAGEEIGKGIQHGF